MNYTHAYGMTSASGAVNKQQVNIFNMKTDGTYSKIVNWAIQDSPNSFKRATIMDIARDYEEKHPGWIVLGGINADQYAMTEHYGGSKSPILAIWINTLDISNVPLIFDSRSAMYSDFDGRCPLGLPISGKPNLSYTSRAP